MNCPECERDLPPDSSACRCGWTKQKQEGKPHIPCAHTECGTSAVIREKTKTGWANFCLYHYEQYHANESLEAYRKLGLERWPDETAQEHKQRVFEYIKLMARTSKMSKFMEKAA